MKRIRFKTLQKRLFTYYSLFFVTLLVIIATIVFYFYNNVTRTNIIENQIQLNHAIVNSLNQELNTINNFSMNLVFSNMVREHFKEELSKVPNSNINYKEDYSEVTTLIDVILAIISSSQPAKQANIYDFNGKMLGAGEFNGQILTDLKQKPWFDKTMELHGNKYLSLMESNQIPTMTSNEGNTYLALTRVFKNQNYVNQGIVEILQDADRFFSYLNEIKTQNENLEIYVLNSTNQLFYPYKQTSKQQAIVYNNHINKNQLQEDHTYDVKGPSETTKLLSYSTTDNMDWRVIVLQDKSKLFAFLNQLTIVFVLLLISTLFVILGISYLVSKRVTSPLENLRVAIQDLDPLDLSNSNRKKSELTNSSIEEIDALHSTFQKMSEKLSESIEELVVAREQEMDAKFLALQSQMNPHFLYNNLANINVMAEEGMNDKIIRLSENMSFMLRYISQMNRKGVKLKEEIDYTVRYLECMDIRYEENLSYSIHIPEGMKEVSVPMLLVQPLVENSIKHGLNIDPPWHISIEGKCDSDIWRVTVTDNGPGFEPSVIKQLQELCNKLDEKVDIPDLHIDGMGIKNIIIRLKLMYGEDAYINIENHNCRGASITIGGKYKE
ncbi:histidine kinase [Radiobacillus kanasensis]|uniref:sensor histidine kinase n=1 Tax=Radiobacillus kanasensis TaxID=2844358 RepID=UPI001E5D25A6|nr:sensor histidine kinase [Radiobacillus kanasensis]UFT98388.1 histidine kinase [Radiobacillus kanasensis]